MVRLGSVATAVPSIPTVVLLGRAVVRLLETTDRSHDDLVAPRERRVTTVVGLPCLLGGLSTMVDEPLAVPFPPLSLTLFGAVATVYPNLPPASLA